MGARSILTAPPYQTPGQLKMAGLRAMRGSSVKAERAAAHLKSTTDLVQNLVDRKKGMVTVRDVKALAAVTGESPTRLQMILVEAKEKFAASAVDYVKMHKETTQAALTLGRGQEIDGVLIGGDPKALDVAMKASQWAIEKMSHKGERIIEKDVVKEGNSGTKIMIGLQLGGKNPSFIEVDPPPTPVE